MKIRRNSDSGYFINFFISLINSLVNRGYGDIIFLINQKEYKSIKSIMCGNNEMLNTLVNYSEFNGIITLFNNYTEIGFKSLERYYGNDEVILDDYNVIPIFNICIECNEENLAFECIKYMKFNMNEVFLIYLLQNQDFINKKYLLKIQQVSEDYIKTKTYKILNKSILIIYLDYIGDLPFNTLKYILSQNINVDKIQLLKSLLYYISKNGYEKEIAFYIISLGLYNVNNNSLDKDEKILLQMLLTKYNKNVDDEMLQMEGINNELKNYIYSKIVNDNLEVLDNEIQILRLLPIENDLYKLLQVNNIKIIFLAWLILIKIGYKINDNNIIVLKILKYYFETNLANKYTVLMSTAPFIRKEMIQNVSDLYGNEVLYMLLHYNDVLSKEQYKEICSFLSNNIRGNEEEIKKFKKTVNDESLINIILSKRLTKFNYPKSVIWLNKNSERSIIPEFDGTGCIFECKYLPKGMTLDRNTGEIYVKSGYNYDGEKYIITCKNVTNSLSFPIEFRLSLINEIHFINTYKHPNIIIDNDGLGISHINEDGYNHCYLNIKMDKGIHHILYKLEGSNNLCGCFYGASSINTYNGDYLHNHTSSCSFGLCLNNNGLYGGNGEKYKKPGRNLRNGEVYECIFNMNILTFSLKYSDGEEILLFRYIRGPLYPFVTNYNLNKVRIFGYWKEH